MKIPDINLPSRLSLVVFGEGRSSASPGWFMTARDTDYIHGRRRCRGATLAFGAFQSSVEIWRSDRVGARGQTFRPSRQDEAGERHRNRGEGSRFARRQLSEEPILRRPRQDATSSKLKATTPDRRHAGESDAIVPSGGFQPEEEEGRRAYAPGERRPGDSGGASLRGLEGAEVEEIAEPFDEDAALDRLRARHRGRGPKADRPLDERWRGEVCAGLAADPCLNASELHVAVRDGEATLAGTVDDRGLRRRAEDMAESVAGVSSVRNDLRVRQPFYTPAGRDAPVETNRREEGARARPGDQVSRSTRR